MAYNTIELPPEYAKIVDYVNDADAAFFEEHPNMKAYVRPYVPGEFYPWVPDHEIAVLVMQRDGTRIRHPMGLVAGVF